MRCYHLSFYSYTEVIHLCVELNGKPIVLTGRHITTPAVNRSVFLPLAVPSTLSRNSEVPNECAYTDTNCTALDTSQHEEEQQDHTSLNQDISETCTAAKMFSRIQHSRSRQRHIEDRLHEKNQAAKSGSLDGMRKSNLGTLGSNRANASSSSIPCDDVQTMLKQRHQLQVRVVVFVPFRGDQLTP